MQSHEHESRLRHQLRTLRRGAPLALLVTALMAAAAIGLSARQDHLYKASADVFLGSQSAASDLTGVSQFYYDPIRAAETQARLANLPAVSQRALTDEQLSAKAASDARVDWSVTTNANADILTFSVTAKDPQVAERLATAYPRAYTRYRRNIDTAGVQEALRNLTAQLSRLRKSGNTDSRIYTQLLEKKQQLETVAALRGSNALLVRKASSPVQIQPKPSRNAVLGGILGLFLGILLVFVRDALNTRVRSVEEAEQRLRLPLLGRIPPLKTHRENGSRLAMVDEPASVDAEVFRMLATNIDFMNIDRGATSMMVTGANRAEGKSTSAVNIAAAYARRGLHVILVDLDLRSPSIAKMLDLDTRIGVTSVALGRSSIDEALVQIPLEQRSNDEISTSSRSALAQQGILEVLPAGALPPDASEFVASPSMTRLLAELSERADLLLIDTPPVLPVSDALALSPRVDAVLIVTRLGEVRRSALNELARLLDSAPIVKLGFIVTGAGADEDQAYGGYGYGYGYGHGYGEADGAATPKARRTRTRIRRRRDQPAPAEADPQVAPAQPAAPPPAPRVSDSAERSLVMRTVDHAKLLRALELFNRSEEAGDIAGISRSVAPPVANVRVWDSASAEVMLTIAWQGAWYQFVVDLSDTEDAVRMWASGEDVDQLPTKFKDWNVHAQSNGRLMLSEDEPDRAPTLASG